MCLPLPDGRGSSARGHVGAEGLLRLFQELGKLGVVIDEALKFAKHLDPAVWQRFHDRVKRQGRRIENGPFQSRIQFGIAAAAAGRGSGESTRRAASGTWGGDRLPFTVSPARRAWAGGVRPRPDGP